MLDNLDNLQATSPEYKDLNLGSIIFAKSIGLKRKISEITNYADSKLDNTGCNELEKIEIILQNISDVQTRFNLLSEISVAELEKYYYQHYKNIRHVSDWKGPIRFADMISHHI